VNASILLGYTEATGGVRTASGVGRGQDHSREADLVLFLVIQTHSSRRDDALGYDSIVMSSSSLHVRSAS
jgi:hypothetical protein